MPRIDIPNVGLVDFPDSMSDAEITQAIERDILKTSQAKPQGLLSFVKDQVTKAITPESRYQSVMSGKDGTVVDSRPEIERRGAPVTQETFNAVKKQYDNATESQRKQMVDRGDFVGSVAGKVQDQYAKPSSGLTDGRKEKRIAKVAADTGATFETARNIVESDADNGAIPMIGNQQPDREIVDYAKDAVRSVAKIAPTTAKFATDVAGMVTYPIPIVSDMIMTAGDAMQSAIDYQTSQQSPELRAKTAEMQRIIQNGTAADLANFLSENKSVLADVAIPSLGFMLASGGIGGAVGRTATEKAAANLGEKYAGRSQEAIKRLAEKYGRDKATQAAIATNVAVNSGGAFNEAEGGAATKYTAAAIAGLSTLIGGKLTEGGAEGVIARGGAGKGIFAATAKTAGKESAQEYMEGAGQALGVQTGETAFGNRDAVDFGQINRQGILEAAAAGVPGAAVGAVSSVAQKQADHINKIQESDAALNAISTAGSVDDAIKFATEAIKTPVDAAPISEVLPVSPATHEALPASDLVDADLLNQINEATNVSDTNTIQPAEVAAQSGQEEGNTVEAGAGNELPADSIGAGGLYNDAASPESVLRSDIPAGIEARSGVDAGNAARGNDVELSGNTEQLPTTEQSSAVDPVVNESLTTDTPTNKEDLTGANVDDDWHIFTPESGSLGIPRAEMPQIKAEHRGAMVNFLNARGITHEPVEVPASELKPTQIEYSKNKVEQAKNYEGGNRSILISSDNHVLDGHHQWLASLDKGETVPAIRLNAPISTLLETVKEFPSAQTSTQEPKNETDDTTGNNVSDQRTAASNDTQDHQLQSAPVNTPTITGAGRTDGTKSEREGARPVIETIVKRRNAAQQMNMLKAFDNHLAKAKSFMAGEAVPPSRFKAAANAFKNDTVLNKAFTDLEELAKAPARDNRQSARSAIDVFTEQINNAKTVDELKSISRSIQMETGVVSDAMAQQLDDLVMERMDAIESMPKQGKDQENAAEVSDNKSDASVETAPVSEPDQFVDDNKMVQESKPNQEKIEDFGEKIGGARKDVWSGFKDKMQQSMGEDVAGVPLSKSWPEPDYQGMIDAGADSMMVAYLRALRDAVPTKPKAGWKVKGWASKTKALRDIAFDITNSTSSLDKLRSELNDFAKYAQGGEVSNISDMADLYFRVGHEKSLKGIRVAVGQYSIHNGIEYKPAKTIWSVEKDAAATAFSNWPKQFATGATKEEAISNFVKAYKNIDVTPPAAKQVSFDIYTYKTKPGKFFIGKKVGKSHIDLKEFDNLKEAREYKANNQAELEALLAKAKEIPSERNAENNPRVGADHRANLSKLNALVQSLIDRSGIAADNLSDILIAHSRGSKLPSFVDVPFESVPSSGSANNMDSLLNKLPSYRLSVFTKFLGNLADTDALTIKGYASLDIPGKRLVQSAMLNIGHNKQVVRRIVELIPVDVMNDLVAAKFSAEGLFGDESMLGDGLAISGKMSVGSANPAALAFINAVAKVTAEIPFALNISRISFKNDPAINAGQFDGILSENSWHSSDVTPEDFLDTFSFFGVQFGNYVTNEQRQQDLNEAYDALMDMAGVLNVPPKAISLNGELGIAFGARGSGGKRPAKAHYESGHIVINLTKNKGAGSLGHEWWHALDNYFSRMRGKSSDFTTEASDVNFASYGDRGYGDLGRPETEIRKEMIDAFGGIVKAIRTSSLRERSGKLDKTRTKDYWSTMLEMTARSFESYLISKLQDQGASNDYLANIVTEEAWGRENDYPYPTAGEIPAIRAAYDNFFDVVQAKETDDGNVALFSRSTDRTPFIAQNDEGYIAALNKTVAMFKSGDRAKQQAAGKTPIPISRTPVVLRQVLEDDGSKPFKRSDFVVGQGSTLYLKADNIHGRSIHSGRISKDVLDKLPQLLADPVAVFKSSPAGEDKKSFKVLLDANDENGNPVIVAIKPNVPMQQLNNAEVNFQATIFPTTWNAINRWNKDGLLRYYNEKSPRASVVPSNPGEAVSEENTREGFDANIGVFASKVKVISRGDIEAMPESMFRREPMLDAIKGLKQKQNQLTDSIQKRVDTITKGWANAPQVEVVFDMNDERIPEAVRRENERQLSQGAEGQPEGFFTGGRVFIVASEMRSADDVARVLFHESLGHFGLRGFYGRPELNKVLDEIALLRKADITAKAKQYGLNLDKESDRRMAAEEVLAEMAQTRPEIGFVKRAIAAIRSWLRENVPYFKGLVLTDDEIIRNYLMPARNFVERGGMGDAVSGVPVFNRANDFSRMVDEVVSGTAKGALTLGNTPASLVATGIPDTKMMVTQSTIDKVLYDHGIPVKTIKALPSLLSKPVMVFKSATQDGNFVVQLDAYKAGSPIVAIIKPNGNIERVAPVNVLASAYAKPAGVVSKWFESGLLIGADKQKALEFATTNGLQLPAVVQQINKSLDVTLIQGDDSVNDDAAFSRTANLDLSRDGDSDLPPEETKTQAIRRQQQDKFNRFKVLREWLGEKGVSLSEDADVYLNETVMSSRIAARKTDFREDFVEPLINKTQAAGIEMETIGDFLKVQHAKEANKRAREIHQSKDATAYGISDEEATKAMEEFEKIDNFDLLKSIANEWRGITDMTKRIKLESGLLTPEMVKAWEETYDNYVPVKGTDQKVGLGKGLNVNAKNKQRLGHELRDEAIIENILRDHEFAITLDEKNRVGKSLIKFALEVSNDKIITIDKPVKRQVLKKGETAYVVSFKGQDLASFKTKQEAGMYVTLNVAMGGAKSDFVIEKTTDPMRVVLMASPLLADNEVEVYVGGHAVRLQINDEIAAREYKNMGVEHLNSVLAASRDFNNWLSKAYTSLSPDFILTNPIRDAIQGSIVLTGRYGAGITAKIYKNYPKALFELAKNLKNKGSSQLVKEYRSNGGQIGAAYMSDLDRIGNDIQDSYNEYQGALKTFKNTYDQAIEQGNSESIANIKAVYKSGIVAFKKVPIAGHFLRLIESTNAVFENALRLATYDTLKNEIGESGLKSAAAAKELMNFNRKGEQQAMSALFLFYNPSIQGTSLMYESIFDSPHKIQAQALTGMMALGAIAVSALAMSGDDDDKDRWNKTPDSVKDSNVVIGIGDKQITITLPYGFKMFWTLGNVIFDAMEGKDLDALAIRMAVSVFENLSPIGNPINENYGRMEFNPFQLMPTALKMMLGPTSVNQDGFGNQITPNKWNQYLPDSQLMNRATHGSLYDSIAERLNDYSGGDKYKPGYVDVSPETLKYWVKSLTGGAGQFVIDSMGIAKNAVHGVAPQDIKDMPVARRFLREGGVYDSRARFYALKNRADIAISLYRSAKKNKDKLTAKELKDGNRELMRMAKLGREMIKMANAKRDLLVSIRNDENMTLADKQIKMKEAESAEKRIYDKFVKEFESKVK